MDGSTTIRTQLYSPRGLGPTGRAKLPASDLPSYHPSLNERLQEELHTHLPWIGAFGAAAALGASVLARHRGAGVVATALAGVVGLVAGTVVGTVGGTAVSQGLQRLRHEADPASVGSFQHLRVMTYNVHGGMGGPGATVASQADLDALAATIAREDPDVVILQEADRYNPRSVGTNTVRDLAARLHPDSAVFATRTPTAWGAQEGVGMLTFHGTRIADARAFEHHVASGTPRVTLDALIETAAGDDVRVLGGHYSGSHEPVDTFGAQVEPTAEQVERWDGPTIWAADWNVNSDSPRGHIEAARLGQAGLTDAFTAVGIPLADPRRASFSSGTRIDRAYVSSQFHVASAQVVRAPAGTAPASDHSPVVVDLDLSPTR